MDGYPRVAVITGASSGIGLFTAKALAAQGWRIIGQGRHPERTTAAEAEIRAVARPGVSVDLIQADLSLLGEAARLADQIAARTDQVDILLNNAGGASDAQVITAEGNEATFAGNHLGHFVLTNKLLPLLTKTAANAAPGATRIINTSSSAHEATPGLNWDDLQMFEGFVPMAAYCNAKLANVLFTRALAKRLSDSGIVVHAVHPGAVDTNFISYVDPATQAFLREHGMISVEEGADTLIWLAVADEPARSSGQYWHERKTVPTSAFASDAEAAERLWRESEKLTSAAMT